MNPGDLVKSFQIANQMSLWALDPEHHRDMNELAGVVNKDEIGMVVARKTVVGYDVGRSKRDWCLVLFLGDRLGWVPVLSLEPV